MSCSVPTSITRLWAPSLKKETIVQKIIQFKACRGLKHLRSPVPCISSFLNLPNCKTLSIVAWLPLFLLLPALSFPSFRTPRHLFSRVPIASCSHLLPKITRKQLLFCLSLYNLILFSLILRHKPLNKEITLGKYIFCFPSLIIKFAIYFLWFSSELDKTRS